MARHFKCWLDAYQEYTQYSEAPDQFHLWTGIGTIAGALRRRVRLDMGYFTWFPNFFICFVAPPGIVSKSTTADIGMRLLRQVEGIKFGPSSATWQSLIQGLANCSEDYPVTPGPITPATEFLTMSSMTVVASELGTFLDPEDRKSIDMLVNLWDCPEGTWEKSTKMDGTETVVNPWFQLIGCTTPSWIAENMGNYFIGGGFASRTLFIFSDTKRQLVAYPDKHIPKGHRDLADKLVADLREISSLFGDYKLSPEATRWGTKWYEEHYTQDNVLRSDERFGGYFARKQTHIHKTAMVFAASQRSELVITEEDLTWAHAQVTALEPSMLRVFGEMNKEEIVGVQDALMSILLVAEGRRMKKDHLFREVLKTIGYETYEKALNSLYGAGFLRIETHGETTFLALTEHANYWKASRHAARPRPPLRLIDAG